MSVVESTGQPVSWDADEEQSVAARRSSPAPVWSVGVRNS
jgi:hypothetical protein